MAETKTVKIENAKIFESGRDYNIPRIYVGNPAVSFGDTLELAQLLAEAFQLEPGRNYFGTIEVNLTLSEGFSPEEFINRTAKE